MPAIPSPIFWIWCFRVNSESVICIQPLVRKHAWYINKGMDNAGKFCYNHSVSVRGTKVPEGTPALFLFL